MMGFDILDPEQGVATGSQDNARLPAGVKDPGDFI